MAVVPWVAMALARRVQLGVVVVVVAGLPWVAVVPGAVTVAGLPWVAVVPGAVAVAGLP